MDKYKQKDIDIKGKKYFNRSQYDQFEHIVGEEIANALGNLDELNAQIEKEDLKILIEINPSSTIFHLLSNVGV